MKPLALTLAGLLLIVVLAVAAYGACKLTPWCPIPPPGAVMPDGVKIALLLLAFGAFIGWVIWLARKNEDHDDEPL